MSKPSPKDPHVILVLASWSSGSTAVTGYLARIGAWSCPPHQLTNDPRTPDSYESKAFRDALCKGVDELTLQERQPQVQFRDFFAGFLAKEKEKARENGCGAIVLKHPLAIFRLKEIFSLCDPKILIVTRSLVDIEESRRRRRWHPVYGVEGAKKIYSTTFSEMIAHNRSFRTVAYREFLDKPTLRTSVAEELGLCPTSDEIASGEAWLSSSVKTPVLAK